MERISDISERNRLRAMDAIITAPDLLLYVFVLARGSPPHPPTPHPPPRNGEEELSRVGMEERPFLSSLRLPRAPFLSLSLSLTLLARLCSSRAFSRLAGIRSIILSARRFQFALFLRHYRAPRPAQNCI